MELRKFSEGDPLIQFTVRKYKQKETICNAHSNCSFINIVSTLVKKSHLFTFYVVYNMLLTWMCCDNTLLLFDLYSSFHWDCTAQNKNISLENFLQWQNPMISSWNFFLLCFSETDRSPKWVGFIFQAKVLGDVNWEHVLWKPLEKHLCTCQEDMCAARSWPPGKRQKRKG